ncbi:MAG TPA: ABC transporter substrate-binding protein [Mycobacteriales bacterium]|nr:ABC transporter substrate-binding protein [Mycobacteriales bacterium]
MRTTRAMRTVTAVLALTLSAVACGDDGGGGGPGGGGGTTTGGTFEPKGTKGGTLEIVSNGDADYLDPQRTYSTIGIAIQRALNRQLLTYKAAPADSGGLELVPDLAKAMPEVSADGLTYTFELKDGIKFEDGAEITAADVKYGVERSFELDTLSGGPEHMRQTLAGGLEFKGIYQDPKGLSSIKVDGDKKISFTLKQPYADFRYVAALPTTTPVQKANDTKDKFNLHPTSTGPYKIVSYKPEKEIVFDRNPNWDPKTDEVRKAYVDRIEITEGVDTADILNRLESGDADISLDTTVEPQDIARVTADPVLKEQSNKVNTGCVRYLSLNTKVAPFDNPKVREAMQYAVNKETYRTARGGPTAGDFATSMLPPTFGQESFDLYPAAPTGDAAKAKALFAEAGYTGGKILMLATNAGKGLASAQAVQAALKPFGMNVELKQVAPGVFFTELGTPSKNYAMGIAGWCADWPSPSTYLGPLFDGTQIKPNGNQNYSQLDDPAINKLIAEANREGDTAKANAKWFDIDRKIMESGAIVPLLYDSALFFHSARLKNAFIHPYLVHEDFTVVAVQ